MGGLEPPLREELDTKSSAATNYATSAFVLQFDYLVITRNIISENFCKNSIFADNGKIFFPFISY